MFLLYVSCSLCCPGVHSVFRPFCIAASMHPPCAEQYLVEKAERKRKRDERMKTWFLSHLGSILGAGIKSGRGVRCIAMQHLPRPTVQLFDFEHPIRCLRCGTPASRWHAICLLRTPSRADCMVLVFHHSETIAHHAVVPLAFNIMQIALETDAAPWWSSVTSS